MIRTSGRRSCAPTGWTRSPTSDPGLELEIPATQVLQANRALEDALDVIQQATEEGARLFAPDEIAEAIRLRDQGIAERQEGQWDEAIRLAGLSTMSASQALALAIEQRDAAAEALLSDRQGSVEGQRPQDLVWTDRALNDILIEEEKVRTLSRSTAQITFRDDSRLRLNANSQALIQRMRVDPLSREEEAKVSLIEGDFYALLAGKSQRKNFELEVPEVETQIDSTNFWVRRDDSGSKFTNYDERVLQVSAQGESVDLGRNEATLVRSGAPPSDKIDILPPPALLAPQDDAVAFNAAVELAWSPVADAAGYWVEVAYDPGFRRMVQSRWGLTEDRYDAGALDIGAYYWRVAALDKFGLPGERTDAWRFYVQTDVTPPYLSIGGPEEGAILRETPIRLQGESEPGATLELNGEPVPIDPDGLFDLPYRPSPGLNTVIDRSARCGRQHDRTPARVRVHARPAGGGGVRPGDPTPLRPPLPDRSRGDLARRAYRRRCPRRDRRGRRYGARIFLRRSGRTVRRQRAAARARGALHGAGHGAIGLRHRGRVPGVGRPGAAADRARVPAATGHRRGMAAAARPAPGRRQSPDRRPARDADRRDVRRDHHPAARDPTRSSWSRPISWATSASRSSTCSWIRSRRSWSVSRCRPAALRPATRLTVEVVASDASGMKQAAPFTLRVGDATLSDFLRFNPSSGSYRSTFVVSEGMQGPVALKEVELEDYAGNRQRYTF